MLRDEKKLRRVSDDIYQEIDPTENGRHLEWRRSFNYVTLHLKNVRPVISHSVAELSIARIFSDDAKKDIFSTVSPEIQTKRVIFATVDKLQQDDQLFFLSEADADGLSTVNQSESLEVTISVGEPNAEDRSQGFQRGTIESAVHLTSITTSVVARISGTQMLHLYEAAMRHENLAITLHMLVLSYSFEVDDYFRSVHDRRYLALHPHSHAVVRAVECTPVRQRISRDASLEDEPSVEEPPTNMLAVQLASTRKALSSIQKAIWILIGIAFVALFK